MKKTVHFEFVSHFHNHLKVSKCFQTFVYFIQTTSDHSNLLTKAIAQRVSVQHRIALCDQFHLAIAASSLLKPLANGKEYLVNFTETSRNQSKPVEQPSTHHLCIFYQT